MNTQNDTVTARPAIQGRQIENIGVDGDGMMILGYAATVERAPGFQFDCATIRDVDGVHRLSRAIRVF